MGYKKISLLEIGILLSLAGNNNKFVIPLLAGAEERLFFSHSS